VSIAAVVLAAGASRRLGTPKQVLMHEGEMLVARAARIAAEASLFPVLVVMRSDAEFNGVLESLGYRCVVNKEAEEGMAASIRCGVAEAKEVGASGVVILPCDQPALDATHLRKLMEEPEYTASSSYGNIRGIPAYFPAAQFDVLQKLRGDVGARDLLRSSRAVENEALAFDIDTPDDAQRLTAR
jgi:molybdenum cofactor cytidylyltransferase